MSHCFFSRLMPTGNGNSCATYCLQPFLCAQHSQLLIYKAVTPAPDPVWDSERCKYLAVTDICALHPRIHIFATWIKHSPVSLHESLAEKNTELCNFTAWPKRVGGSVGRSVGHLWYSLCFIKAWQMTQQLCAPTMLHGT